MKNEKYILVFLILFVAFAGFGQSYCNPNGISTNPDNPVNTHSPMMTNNFFDWRKTDFATYFDSDYFTNNPLPSTSPYWSTEDYLDYLSGAGTDGNEIDYAPSEGWELIARGFGKFVDGTTNNDFYSPYFLMYNKYLSRLRFLFSLPSTGVNSAFQSMRVSLEFTENTDGGIFYTGIFGGIDGLSQPMDQNSDNVILSGIANYVEDGWSHAEFDVEYDPCTCMANSAFKLTITGIQEADVDLTGLFLGLNTPLGIFAGSKYEDEDRLMTVLGSGINEGVGRETYKSIDKWIEKSKNTPNTFIDQLVSKVGKLLPYFDLAAELGLFSLVDTTFAKSAKANAKIAKKVNTVLKKFSSKKKTFPSVIQGEMALSGTVSMESEIDRARFSFDNPGTAPVFVTPSNEFLGPRYPIYNEVLGRFALLKTPVVKWSSENTSYTEVLPDPASDVENELISCQGKKVLKLDESSIKYVFNPAADIDEGQTEILMALVISDPAGDNILENDVEVDGFFDWIGPPVEHFQVNRTNWEKTYLDKDGHVKYFSPFLPLECLGNLASETSTFIEYETDNGYAGNVSFDYCDFVGEYGNVAPKVELRFIINYVFNTNNRNGNRNRALQILTYPVEMQQVELSEITNDLVNVAQGNLSLSGSISGNIAAFGTITITGPLVNTLGSPIDIVAQEIIVAPGVIVPDGFNLIIGIPPQCGGPIGTASVDCSAGVYKANALSMPAKTRIAEAKKLEERRKEFRLGSFPNPFSDQFVVEYNLEQDEDVELLVRNELGEIVLRETFDDDVKGQHFYQVDGSHFPTGIYFLTIQTDTNLKTVKLIKQVE